MPFFRHWVNIVERGLSHESVEIRVHYYARTNLEFNWQSQELCAQS